MQPSCSLVNKPSPEAGIDFPGLSRAPHRRKSGYANTSHFYSVRGTYQLCYIIHDRHQGVLKKRPRRTGARKGHIIKSFAAINVDYLPIKTNNKRNTLTSQFRIPLRIYAFLMMRNPHGAIQSGPMLWYFRWRSVCSDTHTTHRFPILSPEPFMPWWVRWFSRVL